MASFLSNIGRSATRFGPIGLEISLEYVHLVQLQMSSAGVALRACASEPMNASFEDLLQEPKQLKEVIKSAYGRQDFKGRQVVTSMPSTMTRVLSVNYELSNGQNDSQAITKLLLDRIGDDLADFVVDFMPINQEQRVTDRAALIAMCRKDSVNAYLETLNACKLEPIALEIGPVAIKRLVDSLQSHSPMSTSLVVNCGREKSYLTLISKRQLLSDDEVNFGERTVVQRICSALDVTSDLAHKLLAEVDLGADKPDENTRTLIEIIRPELNELIRDIERGMVYATNESRGQDDTTIFLIGSIARWTGADRLISNILKHPVKTIPDPLLPFMSTQAQEVEVEKNEIEGGAGRPELAVATGLALRDIEHG